MLPMGAAVALSACTRDTAPPAPARQPEQAALLLFRVAWLEPAPGDGWKSVIEENRLAEDPLGIRRTADALKSLSNPEVLRVEPLDPLRRAAVDVACALPGGGRAHLVIQVERVPDGTWRVVSIEGPGVGWPQGRAPSGEGLSTSAPP
jgi:hypothetical protein